MRQVVVAAEPESDVLVALHEADEGFGRWWRRRRRGRRRRRASSSSSSSFFFSPLFFSFSVQRSVVEIGAPVPHMDRLHDPEAASCRGSVREDDDGLAFELRFCDLGFEPRELRSVEVDCFFLVDFDFEFFDFRKEEEKTENDKVKQGGKRLK